MPIKPFTTLLLACLSLTAAHGRNFTSSDGQKTISAEFVRYSKKDDTVTLRLTNGRNLVTSSKFFSEADREFFAEQAKKMALFESIQVEMTKNKERVTTKGRKMGYHKDDVSCVFQIENGSGFDMEDLQVKHWVVVQYDNQKEPKVYSGSETISCLDANSQKLIPGPKISLTISAFSTCSCPRVVEAARKVGRDRILGERVEVRTSDGNLVFENSSSQRVDKIIQEAD